MNTFRHLVWGWGLVGWLGIAQAQLAAPRFACDEPTFDFGERDNSTTVVHDFVIRNDGNATLEITGIRPSCGCTVANVSRPSLEPGQATTLTARFTLEGRTGPQHKTIAVESNDPRSPQSVLALTGTAVALVDVVPRTVYASNLLPGQAVTNVIKITSREDEPLEIVSIDTGNPLVRAEAVEVVAGREYDVVVRAGSDLPKGATYGRIALQTSSKRLPVANVAYRYNVIGEISVYPQELTMLEQDRPLNKTIVITPGTVTDFTVTEVRAPSSDIGVEISKLGGGRYRVVLSNIVPSRALDGKEVHVRTTAANMEDVPVRFRIIPRG